MAPYLIDNITGAYVFGQALNHPISDQSTQTQIQMALTGNSAWNHAAGPWLLAIFLLVGFSVLFLGLAWRALRRLETGRQEGKTVGALDV